MKNLISMRDLTNEEILHLMDVAAKIENGEIVPDMQRKLAALLFFEPSTRTMFSFDTAMKRMNGDTIIMSGTGQTSVKKGESFADTLQTVAQYSDIIIISVNSTGLSPGNYSGTITINSSAGSKTGYINLTVVHAEPAETVVDQFQDIKPGIVGKVPEPH